MGPGGTARRRGRARARGGEVPGLCGIDLLFCVRTWLLVLKLLKSGGLFPAVKSSDAVKMTVLAGVSSH